MRPVQGTVTTKLKGAWHYNGSNGDYTQNCVGDVEEITFDVADYVIPPQVDYQALGPRLLGTLMWCM